MTKFTDQLLTEREAASCLKLRIATLQRWRWAGKGPRFVKLEGAVRYDPSDLIAFVEASRRQSTSDAGLSNKAGDQGC
jgi:hypothetical protein